MLVFLFSFPHRRGLRMAFLSWKAGGGRTLMHFCTGRSMVG